MCRMATYCGDECVWSFSDSGNISSGKLVTVTRKYQKQREPNAKYEVTLNKNDDRDSNIRSVQIYILILIAS